MVSDLFTAEYRDSDTQAFLLFVVWRGTGTSGTSIHFLDPLIPIYGHGGAGAYPSCHWVRGRVHPGQVASPSQGHTETNETNNHTHS